MKTLLPFGLALAALALSAGCASSPSSRIAKNRAEFDAYPQEVQAAISAGDVRVGFTPEQARLALGAPDRVVTRTSETGESEVWIYQEKQSRLGVGLGLGIGSGPVGGGVGVSSGGGGSVDDRLRVVFTGGRVSAVEQSQR
jgi:outer membrane protein assembly factor BamE (lipoprotein component of BamABCDE complex)